MSRSTTCSLPQAHLSSSVFFGFPIASLYQVQATCPLKVIRDFYVDGSARRRYQQSFPKRERARRGSTLPVKNFHDASSRLGSHFCVRKYKLAISRGAPKSLGQTHARVLWVKAYICTMEIRRISLTAADVHESIT